MKRKFKLKGVTDYAERHLSSEDLESLNDMIGSKVTECFERSVVDGKRMIDMPDGERTHIDYLKLEEIQPELEFKTNS